MMSRASLAGLAMSLITTGSGFAAPSSSPPDSPPIPTTSHAVIGKDYPQVARQLREEGEVTIRYRVEPDGTVSECQIVISSNEPRLDITACLLARRNWKFIPATRDGMPVAEYMESNVSFRLDDTNL